MKRVIFCIAAGLICVIGVWVFAEEDSIVTNGTFDTDLSGWSLTEEGVGWESNEGNGVALLSQYFGTVWGPTFSELWQLISFPGNADQLSFDITMTVESAGGGPETDVLSVSVGGNVIYTLDSDQVMAAALNGEPEILEDPAPVIVDGEEGDRLVLFAVYHINITQDVSSLQNQTADLKFSLLNDLNDEMMAIVTVDDVAVSVSGDQTPPVVQIGEMMELWPPNHKYRTFKLSDCVQVTDGEEQIDVDQYGRILSICSDEPEDVSGNGDGKTEDDMVIVDDISFQLRSERQGKSNGRVYGVTFEVVDAAGNLAEATFYLGVPHDKSGGTPVDDGAGAGYTVTNP
jgi:hypothetical protein